MSRRKEPRIDAKLKRAPREQQDELWNLRNPPDGEGGVSLEELQLEVPRVCGFTISLSSLSDWLSWYAVERDFENAASVTEQVRELLKSDPTLTRDQVEAAAQLVFTNKAMREGDAKLFIGLKRLSQKDRDQEQDDRRIRLLEEAASAAKAKLNAITEKAKSKGGISEETLAEIEQAAGLL